MLSGSRSRISGSARPRGVLAVTSSRSAAPAQRNAANETVVEATYTASITSYLTLQPDIQLVLNPGAGVPGPLGSLPLTTAIVIGTRATIKS